MNHSCITKKNTTSAPVNKEVETPSSRSIRPNRVTARREIELLCIIADDDLDFEWHDEIDCDVDGLSVTSIISKKHGTPLLEENDDT